MSAKDHELAMNAAEQCLCCSSCTDQWPCDGAFEGRCHARDCICDDSGEDEEEDQ